jgi:hypothetical protein
MALSEIQISNLFEDGKISDFNTLSVPSKYKPDHLLQEFVNDDYSGINLNEYLALAGADVFDDPENLSEQTQERPGGVPENQISGKYNALESVDSRSSKPIRLSTESLEF